MLLLFKGTISPSLSISLEFNFCLLFIYENLEKETLKDTVYADTCVDSKHIL